MKDIGDILAVMPHRYPFLLIDRVIEMDDTSIRAIKNVTVNEPHFLGHFPDVPVMPGVLIVEAMAQAGGFLLLNKMEDRAEKLIYFTGIDKCRFRKPVVPGDQVVFEIQLLAKKRGFAKIQGSATVDGDVVCSAELMCALADR